LPALAVTITRIDIRAFLRYTYQNA
jgi:hypothetical protein